MSGSECCDAGGCGCQSGLDKETLFAIAKDASLHSTCVKTKTGALIVKDGIRISTGQNRCAPDGHNYGDTIEKCPREGMKTGTGYELCKPIHAEVMACLNAKSCPLTTDGMAKFAGHLAPSEEEIRAAFTPAELEWLLGATLYLVGHYYACENCQRFCSIVGIKEILFDDVSGQATKDRYKERGITNELPSGSD